MSNKSAAEQQMSMLGGVTMATGDFPNDAPLLTPETFKFMEVSLVNSFLVPEEQRIDFDVEESIMENYINEWAFEAFRDEDWEL